MFQFGVLKLTTSENLGFFECPHSARAWEWLCVLRTVASAGTEKNVRDSGLVVGEFGLQFGYPP